VPLDRRRFVPKRRVFGFKLSEHIFDNCGESFIRPIAVNDGGIVVIV
jgi:hypothetical protein